jgi:hypothetical protein
LPIWVPVVLAVVGGACVLTAIAFVVSFLHNRNTHKEKRMCVQSNVEWTPDFIHCWSTINLDNKEAFQQTASPSEESGNSTTTNFTTARTSNHHYAIDQHHYSTPAQAEQIRASHYDTVDQLETLNDADCKYFFRYFLFLNNHNQKDIIDGISEDENTYQELQLMPETSNNSYRAPPITGE